MSGSTLHVRRVAGPDHAIDKPRVAGEDLDEDLCVSDCDRERPAALGRLEPPPDFGNPAAELILVERLKAAGCATGMVVKWHVGYRRELAPPNRGVDQGVACLAVFLMY